MKKLMNQNWFIAIVFMVLYKPAIFHKCLNIRHLIKFRMC